MSPGETDSVIHQSLNRSKEFDSDESTFLSDSKSALNASPICSSVNACSSKADGSVSMLLQ